MSAPSATPQMPALVAPTDKSLDLRFVSSLVCDLFSALHREVSGRAHWEYMLLPRPLPREAASFADAVDAMGTSMLHQLSAHASRLDRVTDLVRGTSRYPDAHAAATSMAALAPLLEDGLDRERPSLGESWGTVGRAFERALPAATRLVLDALGLGGLPAGAGVVLVPAAHRDHPCRPFEPIPAQPHLLGVVDFGAFRGTDLAEAVLFLAAESLSRRSDTGPACPPAHAIVAATGLGGDAARRLTELVHRVLVHITTAEAIRQHVDTRHRDTADGFGLFLGHRGLLAALRPAWLDLLRFGSVNDARRRDAAVREAARRLENLLPEVCEPADVSVLAADFYLLEHLAGLSAPLRRRFELFCDETSVEFATYLQAAIGAELGHVQRLKRHLDSPDLATFVLEVNRGASGLSWARIFDRDGIGALEMARRAFAGPCAEFGGERWEPIAHTLWLYLSGRIGPDVFVDQCFTLRHNNGPLFDKCYDVRTILPTLDAQARGDLDALARVASPWVRSTFARTRLRDAQAPPPSGPSAGRSPHIGKGGVT